jgi:hypothetical protein
VAQAERVVTLFRSVHSHSPTSLSAFPAAICSFPIIGEMPQNYNNYIQTFREKASTYGHQVKNSLPGSSSYMT